jgi:two-component system chemotaxis response regulator CheB
MGKDGAKGLLDIRRAGGATVAQDEATSVVFGMPHMANKLGGAKCIAALDTIPSILFRSHVKSLEK